MQGRTLKRLLQNGLLLSLVLHFIILLCTTSLLWVHPEKKQKTPQLYVPSYVYTPPPTMPMQQSVASASQPQTTPVQQKTVETAKNGTERKAKPATPAFDKRSLLDFSRNIIHQNQMRQAVSQLKSEDPILLIGDKNEIADPFTRLIGRALSAHFIYPRTEGEFGIKGRVLVKLMLNPNGRFTDVQIVRSSNNRHFDSAALYAVNAAPAIRGITKFLTKPKQVMVQFIFD